MYQNYLFDLYGTLVDIHTNEEKASVWNNLACFMSMQNAPYQGNELKTQFQHIKTDISIAALQLQQSRYSTCITMDEIEISFADIIERLYKEKGIAASPFQVETWAILMRTLSYEHLCLFDWTLELLQQLKKHGKRIYLLSNAQRLFTEPEMKMLGIDSLFDDIFYSSDIGFKKPSQRFYRMPLEKYHLDPNQTVMVGNDFYADAWGAANAGLDSIYIHTKQSPSFQKKLPSNCRQLTDLREIL